MKPTTTGTDPTTLKAAYASFPTGVAAVCAQSGGELIGMAASSFTAVSLDPPLVSVCVMNTSRTWQRLRGSARLGVSILAADQGAVCAAIGRRRVDRFAGIDTAVSPEDAVFVRGAGVWLDCEVQSLLPAGDHTIVLLRVVGLDVDADRQPLVYLAGDVRELVPRMPKPGDRTAPVGAGGPAVSKGVLS
ncbi:flavin reductase family protein [Prescottella equi]|uniref:flavin reductase family protein n=1 Tax=Rhodococcus hoagii TaxID=43767 RepID=UPI000A114CB6|nr:flavin reductase family protein [Prescottella equi]ORM11881.1 flavin reductase [Prescottella equi]